MNDMSSVIVPKSDQINADDLIAGPRVITITGVDIRPGTEQPVTVHYDGEDGRPWKPCKSMSRLMVAAWGPDANRYVGRSLTLYRDPSVKWGGMAIGGIRVSHMTDLPEDKVSNGRMIVQLTETRGKRSPCVVQPLVAETKPDSAQAWANAYVSKVEQAADMNDLEVFVSEKAAKLAELQAKRPELHAQCVTAVEARRSDLSMFADEGEAADDAPAWTEVVERIKREIDACATSAELEKVRADYETHASALPGDVRTTMDHRFETMGRALDRRGA